MPEAGTKIVQVNLLSPHSLVRKYLLKQLLAALEIIDRYAFW